MVILEGIGGDVGDMVDINGVGDGGVGEDSNDEVRNGCCGVLFVSWVIVIWCSVQCGDGGEDR